MTEEDYQWALEPCDDLITVDKATSTKIIALGTLGHRQSSANARHIFSHAQNG